jgi:hypothetical protein
MPLPSFLVFGVPKAGTTALYFYLRQHPQVFMSPVKEPGFFDHDPTRAPYCGPGDEELARGAVTDPAAYRALFRGVWREAAVGEASVYYLYSPLAAARVAAEVPNVRLVAVLRHPAERAYSAYLHNLGDGRERLADFAQALHEESARREQGFSPYWRYRDGGFYYAHLAPWLARFSRHRMRLHLHEDLERDPVGLLQDVFRFLGVDDRFVPDVSVRHNVSGVPRGRSARAVHGLMDTPNPLRTVAKAVLPASLRYRIRTRLKIRNLVKPAFPPDVRAELVAGYREDTLRLQDLLGRDLSAWLR